jgi:hypothetical protein
MKNYQKFKVLSIAADIMKVRSVGNPSPAKTGRQKRAAMTAGSLTIAELLI